MSEYSCFDIIGPVMVGPSSSHTAGAVRLGRLARAIADGLPKSVQIIRFLCEDVSGTRDRSGDFSGTFGHGDR